MCVFIDNDEDRTLRLHSILCGFIFIVAVDSNSQTLQPITLELRRRKISKGSEIPLKRPRLDKNSCESSVCVCVPRTDFISVSLPVSMFSPISCRL